MLEDFLPEDIGNISVRNLGTTYKTQKILV
jgi:hypothetical protein